MSLASMRSAIKSILEGVAGIGVVHDYERWTVDWATYLSLFRAPAQNLINGWTISRASTSEVAFASGRHRRSHRFIVRGYYSQKDAAGSEKNFQDLIEAVCDGLRGNVSLNGTAESSGPPQVRRVESRTLGDVLCHYCEIGLDADEEMTI